ncbi:MAG: FAD-dependent oxidoreductase [Alphaproteobacteria bacterium]|nr:FAD-dependent oxidoreductase [Alphaproteobacteria bacterium]
MFGYNIAFEDLYRRSGLIKIDAAFVAHLAAADTPLHHRLMAARADLSALADKEHSQLLVDLAPHVEDFIGELFHIRNEISALAQTHNERAVLYSCKRLFIQRKAAKALSAEEASHVDGAALLSMLPIPECDGFAFEWAFSKTVMGWLEKEEDNKSLIELAARYGAWALFSEKGKEKHRHGVLFKQPRKLDPEHLVETETELRDGITVLRLPKSHYRARDGFKLTDDKGPLEAALDNAHYCIFCHNQGKDSCSKGLKEKSGEVKKNSLDIALAGCPLEEKISEMNLLKSTGVPLGALAVVTVDNPMCAGTGHRICNDCMKSCIYQKQEPVNIPLVETHVLKDVLALPYGFEIYSLLTRWNPLNIARTIPRAESGYKVLVAGIGPSGYTLAHHLMNDGHTVVGIDGLKIEPLPEHISGVTQAGTRVPFTPIRDITELYEALDERSLAGFGGVAEYGITVRWDKNYLKILRLLLERREQFSMIGGVRFGSSITYDNAWELGFDHVALCMGAGRPTVLEIPNGLARGVRTASDFLMALQLTGAAKKDSIANLQLRLPVVVIGGGLTAIDTATESLAYYPVQVEKFLTRYETLVQERGEDAVRARWSEEDKIVAEEFLAHGRAIREEKKKPNPDVWSLLDSWGGVKLVYRKRLIDAPSYRLNHEEVEKAFEEGIFIAENYEPAAIEIDQFGAVKNIALRNMTPGGTVTVPARTILVAAGTSPNTVLHREDPDHFQLDGKYFRAIDEEGNVTKPERISKPKEVRVLMSLDDQNRAVSFFGDLHPSFAGNVVKAMGSAKQGYPVVSRILKKRSTEYRVPSTEFIDKINAELRATVHAVIRLTPNIIEVVVKAPLAARQFEPGQFYRLQNFEANALQVVHGHGSLVNGQEAPATKDQRLKTTLAMEGLALTGAWSDKEQGLLSTIVLEMGGSSNLCAQLKPGEPVILMGPTGEPTHIPEGETVMLVGGGLGNAVLFSIGKAMRAKGCKVLYFAGYKKAQDRYKIEEIEAASDAIVWACDEAADYRPNRPQDTFFHGNIVEAISAYGDRSDAPILLKDVKRIIAIGSDRMMAAVASARYGVLHPHLDPAHVAIGSINSPMQCMMKEICAQCLQKHVDPVTGKESYVYSCFNQDQLLDHVSWSHLNERLKQNSLAEKLTAEWIDYCLNKAA